MRRRDKEAADNVPVSRLYRALPGFQYNPKHQLILSAKKINTLKEKQTSKLRIFSIFADGNDAA